LDDEQLAFLQQLAATTNVNPRSLVGQVLRRAGVTDSADLLRIISLPHRDLNVAATPDLTPLFRREGSTKTLWPIQSAMLLECEAVQGLVGAVSVGGGKALTSFLLPYAVKSKKTVLFVPAARKAKTLRLIEQWDQDFKIPRDVLRVYSYHDLQSEKQARLLYDELPDFLILDEAQGARHLDTNRGRRLRAYLNEFPETKVAVLTGTLSKKSIKDYAHLIRWALKDRSPVPLEWRALEEWAEALDPSDDPLPFGALNKLCRKTNHVHLESSSKYRCRLTGSRGVIATGESAFQGTIEVARRQCDVPERVQTALQDLRETWQVKGGPEEAAEELNDVLAFARFIRTLANGYYLRWDWPNGVRDQEWLDARAQWSRSVRHVLRYSRDERFDSALRVANAARRRELSREHLDAWDQWAAVKDRRQPPTVAKWIDRFAIDNAVSWLREGPGRICWYDSPSFGEEVAKAAEVDFPRSESEIVTDGRPLVLSSNIFGTGVDGLQFNYHISLYPFVPGAQAFEQMTGRLAREGQSKPVRIEVSTHTPELEAAFEETLRTAKTLQEREGQQQLLLMGWKE